jgi:hypothetical protein
MHSAHTHIRFPTHAIYVTVDELHIHCFKYANHGCDFDVFDIDDQTGASDYILEPLSQIHYRVTFPGESE